MSNVVEQNAANSNKYNLGQLRSQLADPTADPEAVTAEWQKQAEVAWHRSDRAILGLLINSLKTVAFTPPPLLKIYQYYYSGLLATLDGDFKQAAELQQLALDIAAQQPETSYWVATISTRQGVALLRQNKADEAEQVLNNGLETARQYGYTEVEGKLLEKLGAVERFRGNIPQAAYYTQQALEVAKSVADLDTQADALGNLAIYEILASHYSEARQNLESSISIRREANSDLRKLANDYINLGVLYDTMGQYRLAVDAHEMAVNLYEQLGNQLGLPLSMLNLANAYSSLGQPQNALPSASAATEKLRSMNQPILLAASLAIQAKVEFLLSQKFVATQHLAESQTIEREADKETYLDFLSDFYRYLSEATFLLAQNNSQYQQGLVYQQKAMGYFEKAGNYSQGLGLLTANIEALLGRKPATVLSETLRQWWRFVQKQPAEGRPSTPTLFKYAELATVLKDNQLGLELYREGFKQPDPQMSAEELGRHLYAAAQIAPPAEALNLLEQSMQLSKASNSKEINKQIANLRKQLR